MNAPTNGYARRGALYVPSFDLERDVHAAETVAPSLPESAPAPVDGNTERVREHKARVAEADRIRALPTERVLERRQQFAEAEALERLETADHARRLRAAGERERADLTAKAATAAARRSLEANIDVRALQLGRRRQRWTAIAWTVLVLAMLFTMTNVQAFAAAGAPAWSPQWWVAWGVDPLMSLLVVGLLLSRGDLVAVGSREEDRRGEWIVQSVEIGVLLATVAMNVAPEVSPHLTSWALVALHVVVPLAAVAAALVLPIVQEHYATAIAGLYEPTPELDESGGDQYEPADQSTPTVTPTPTPTRRPARRRSTRRGITRTGRRSLDDLRGELVQAVAEGRVNPTSAESIRKGLRVSQDRARALRVDPDQHAVSQ